MPAVGRPWPSVDDDDDVRMMIMMNCVIQFKSTDDDFDADIKISNHWQHYTGTSWLLRF